MTFTFNTTPSILCGAGSLATLGPRARALLGARVAVVTDPGIVKTGIAARALEMLHAVGIETIVFSDVVADPPEAVVMHAVDAARSGGISGVLGLGGGSAMDVAKLVALLARGGERLADIYGIGNVKGARLPLALVPTTAGTGSEVTPISIVTTGETEKKGVVSPTLLPDLAVLDAELTVGLPPAVTAATGVDAMVHAIEAYTSASANNNPISRSLAAEALRLLGASIDRAVFEGGDLEARSNMLLGATLAGQAFANSPVAAVHALAYPLGGHYHLSHGLTNSLVLPHVLRFNQPVADAAYAELAPHAFPALAAMPAVERGRAFVASLATLTERLGLQTRLRDVGVPQGDLAMLAADAMKQTRLLVNNPRPVGEADARAIYEAAW